MSKTKLLFYSQPLAHRFGTALRNNLGESDWQSFDTAVAWVRRSGTKHIEGALKAFLERGGTASFCVGLDAKNTSKEGLESLLGLEQYGYSQVFVYHNEANLLYHPKVYLFSNTKAARLIVGSNNLTEAGLFRNTEAGLQLDGDKKSPAITQAIQALTAWRDTTTPFVRHLNDTLLGDLVSHDYVLPEKSLRKAYTEITKKRKSKDRLFGLQEIAAPTVPTYGELMIPPSAVGTVLLMRVRRASETDRRTQIQIPIRVVGTGFFGDDVSVISAHNGSKHSLSRASARGGLNTFKLELPEIDPMDDPVVRFERGSSGILYQVYDANSALGIPIMEALKRGRFMSPPSTQLTLPKNPTSSTWWRFV